MGLTCTEIMIKNWICYSSFINGDSVVSQWKCSAMTLLSGWAVFTPEQKYKTILKIEEKDIV